MSQRDPIVETRRAREFLDELTRRARAWIPEWELDEDSPDFGRALLQVAARFDAEVAERLARIPEKNARGFLSWLGFQGKAARAARVPVVFRLGARTTEPVLARAPVKLQAAVDDRAIVFETEADIQLAPGQLRAIVAVDASADAFYLPAPSLADIEPDDGLPGQWSTKSFAAAGATRLQLDPALGLAADMLVEAGGAQYRILEVNNDIVTIEPALEAVAGLAAGTPVNKVSAFVPFGATARNRQQHVLYLGHTELLDLEAAATIEVSGVAAIPAGVVWEYWGKRDGEEDADEDEDAVGWQALTPVPVQDGGRIVLRKEKGSVELRQVGTVESRWIRARVDTVAAPTPPVDTIALLVNPGEAATSCPFPGYDAKLAPRLEGIANTMPLVLDQAFYPFGQEPRQFDAFYLGCAEALSKKGAQVNLCFQVASPNLGPPAVLRYAGLANEVMAAVGKDRLLYLLRVDQATGKVSAYEKRKPLQPPTPIDGGENPSLARVPLDGAPQWRPAIWAQDNGFFVAVAAGQEVWAWHELIGIPKQSGWVSYGRVDPSREATIGGIVYVAGTAPCLVVLHGTDLFEAKIGTNAWTRIGKLTKPKPADPTPAAPKPTDPRPDPELQWASLVPVQSGVSDAVELVAIASEGEAYRISRDTGAWECALIGEPKFAGAVRPVAWRDVEGGLVVVGTDPQQKELISLYRGSSESVARSELKLEEKALMFAGSVLDSFPGPNGEPHVVLLARETGGAPIVLAWGPPGKDGTLYEIPVAASVGAFREAGPTVAGSWLAIPGANSDLLVGPAEAGRVLSLEIEPKEAVIDALLDVVETLAPQDLVLRSSAAEPKQPRTIASSEIGDDNKTIYRLDQPLEPLEQPDGGLLMYRRALGRKAAIVPRADRRRRNVVLQLEVPDERLQPGQWLLVAVDNDEGWYQITKIDEADPRLVTLKTSPPEGGEHVVYLAPEALAARVVPMLRIALPFTDYWTPSRVRNAWFSFPGVARARQRAIASVLHQDQMALLAFEGPWKSRPTSVVAVSATAEEWSRQLGDTSSNPELSWEYWNGTGWWTINGVDDGTARLRKNGTLGFKVPPDLQPTDWGGKTNFWIRARLVGGDYGRERVTVKQTEVKKTSTTEQTIDRNTDDIHAPLVVQLQLRYSVDLTRPTWLLTQDSGAIRNQSDANRTDGATVALFVPLGMALAELDAQAVPVAPLQPVAAHCGCKGAAAGAGAGQTAVAAPAGANAPAEPPLATGRALYLGFDARLHGGPLRLLFKAGAEHDHDAFAPLRMEAVDAGRIAPMVAADDTRALGETGLLSFALPAPPQATDLFGEALYWVRLRPALAPGAGDGDWQPDIRGLYLNAVWAQAAETQEFEMLGSSDGAPNQVVFLARPPVLDNTLVLRVREPLGDEERAQLLQSGADTVLSSVPGQPGDWVLWRQVGDPTDSAPGERVYALDAASGEIRFGDGLHGAIVPIGRDAVMAFRYRRTEPSTNNGASTGTSEGTVATAPANGVTDGASLSVVTPVESVEAVFAAGQAAGGANAEDAARVLRFGPARLRHRERVLTAADLEQMALQIAPEVAQARCLRGAGGIRLVLVMRGSQPAASRAQKRELRNALLAAAPPALARKGALELFDPVLRPVSVRLVLATSSLDYSGQVADAATAAVRAMFDPATGAVDGAGWRLGEAPAAADIAACLLDLPHLDSIVEADLFETGADGSLGPARTSLRPHELAVLGGIDLHIVTTETLP